MLYKKYLLIIMSGSFGVLNQKYNTLLALVLDSTGGGGGSQNLQQVLDTGNISTTGLEITDGSIYNTLSNGSLIITNTTQHSSINDTQVGIENNNKFIRFKKKVGDDPLLEINNNSSKNSYMGADVIGFNDAGLSVLGTMSSNAIEFNNVGIHTIDGNALSIDTNGTLIFEGLSGLINDVLTLQPDGSTKFQAPNVQGLQDVLSVSNTSAIPIVLSDAGFTNTINQNSMVLDNRTTLSTYGLSIIQLINNGKSITIDITDETSPLITIDNLGGTSSLISTSSVEVFNSATGITGALTSSSVDFNSVGMNTPDGLKLNIETNGILVLNGLSGLAGDVLTLQAGGNVLFETPIVPTVPNLQQVLDVGNTSSTSLSILDATSQTNLTKKTLRIEDLGTNDVNTFYVDQMFLENSAGTITSSYANNTITFTNTTTTATYTQNTITLTDGTNNIISTIVGQPNILVNDNSYTATLKTLSLTLNNVGISSPDGDNLVLDCGNSLTLSGAGVSGSAGDVLTLQAGGNVAFETPKLTQSGIIPLLFGATSGGIIFTTSYTTVSPPVVILSFNTDGTLTFIQVAVTSYSGSSGNWTGFNWGCSSFLTGASISWFSTA